MGKNHRAPDKFPRRGFVIAAGVLTMAVSGCVGDDDDDQDIAEPDDEETDDDDSGPVVDFTDVLPGDDDAVQVSEHDEYGEILVGPQEETLYMFDDDEQGASESACHDECAENWPPHAFEEEIDPPAGENVAGELTIFEREDGVYQVAANGWPLYFFAADEEPGDTSGQGEGDSWWILDPNGEPIRES